jgi:hypothetical protein
VRLVLRARCGRTLACPRRCQATLGQLLAPDVATPSPIQLADIMAEVEQILASSPAG